MLTNFAYAGAALVEIAGCFAFWAWFCFGHSPWWLVPGTLSLGLFACPLTLVDSDAAGKAYAAYGVSASRGHPLAMGRRTSLA